MPKLSKKEKAERYDALAQERDVWAHYARLLVNDVKPDAEERIREEEADGSVNYYHFRLYDCLQSWGGIVEIVQDIAGNSRKWVDVDTFDAWFRKVGDLPYGIGINTEIRVAAQRLRAERERIFDRHDDARPMTITHAMRNAEDDPKYRTPQ